MASVFLETSSISACESDRTDAASVYRREPSLEWWALFSGAHSLYVSAEVLVELSDPAHRPAGAALRSVRNVPSLELDDEVEGVAQALVRERVMPGPVAGDALHVAVCAVHGVESMLSWNVKHLANPNKTAHLRSICRRLGLVAPAIVTPDLLWGVP